MSRTEHSTRGYNGGHPKPGFEEDPLASRYAETDALFLDYPDVLAVIHDSRFYPSSLESKPTANH